MTLEGQGETVYTFANSIPIPSYLLAITVGNLTRRDIGRRTSVISEPDVVDKDAAELSDLDHYLDLAEQYMGQYIWGNYTIIV